MQGTGTQLSRTSTVPDPDRPYAVDGSVEFNQRMEEISRGVAKDAVEAIGDNLVAVILGGGYGRGEGGVVEIDGVENLYNDLDFMPIVRKTNATVAPKLREVSDAWQDKLGIHVDFGKPLSVDDVRDMPAWLMWQDLVRGHHVEYGPDDILTSNVPDRVLEPLPLIEATRLLLNRGAGVVWALRVLHGLEIPWDEDFVRRNFQKCALAIGDAALIVYGRFQTAYRGRDEILDQLAEDEPAVRELGIQEVYREALEFKFRPDRSRREGFDVDEFMALGELWTKTFLLTERQRTGQTWSSFQEYAEWSGIREKSESGASRWLRNFARNLRVGRISTLHPREKLYRDLGLLIQLGGQSSPWWNRETERFLESWKRYN